MGASLADGPSVALGAGHREWLAALYEAHFPAVFRLCSRVLRNPDDAADASQEVFLVAANSLERNATAARARAWLLTVARNHCLDLLRRRQRLGRALVTLGGGSGGDPDPQTAVVDRDFVDGVLRKLSVLVHPGHFYDFYADGYLVISLITPPEQFREGMARVLQFLNS